MLYNKHVHARVDIIAACIPAIWVRMSTYCTLVLVPDQPAPLLLRRMNVVLFIDIIGTIVELFHA